MNILLIHNYYQVRGGEDAVVENEKAMLEKHGNTVIPFFIHNDEIKKYSMFDKLLLGPRIVYNGKILKRIKALILEKKIDVVHVHNFWPLISPSIFFLFNSMQVPYVQTIHNYRYIVPNALLYKNDVKQPNNILNINKRKGNSYKGSYLLTFIYWLTALFVKRTRIISNGSGSLQLLNRFSYSVHSQQFNADKLVIRGNFLPDSIAQEMHTFEKEDYYLFLGRLSEEKGIVTLIEGFCKSGIDGTLKIAGGGPLESELKDKYKSNPKVDFVGFVSGTDKNILVAKAKALVIPSEWQEVFPVSFMEANFCTTPVIAARIGGLPDMMIEDETGLLFESGDSEELSKKFQWCENNPDKLASMSKAARLYAKENFSEEKNYEQLIAIYKDLISKVGTK